MRHEVGAPKNENLTGNCTFSGEHIAVTPVELQQTGVAKIQCPECGAIWTARERRDYLFSTTPDHYQEAHANHCMLDQTKYRLGAHPDQKVELNELLYPMEPYFVCSVFDPYFVKIGQD